MPKHDEFIDFLHLIQAGLLIAVPLLLTSLEHGFGVPLPPMTYLVLAWITYACVEATGTRERAEATQLRTYVQRLESELKKCGSGLPPVPELH